MLYVCNILTYVNRYYYYYHINGIILLFSKKIRIKINYCLRNKSQPDRNLKRRCRRMSYRVEHSAVCKLNEHRSSAIRDASRRSVDCGPGEHVIPQQRILRWKIVNALLPRAGVRRSARRVARSLRDSPEVRLCPPCVYFPERATWLSHHRRSSVGPKTRIETHNSVNTAHAHTRHLLPRYSQAFRADRVNSSLPARRRLSQGRPRSDRNTSGWKFWKRLLEMI